MDRRCGASKENRRPAGSVSSLQQDEKCSVLPRRPLGERKPNNKPAVDVGPCLQWLQGAVAHSRALKPSQASAMNSASPRSPISGCKMFNSSSSSSSDASLPLANAPPAQPSRSPDIIRKKSSRDLLDGCFGIGPTVKGDVKDRRKSKPRALLTVEPLPNVATLSHRGLKGKALPRPGRASLEWISDDPDTDSNTDGSSGDSSLCSGFDYRGGEWKHLRASRIYGKLNTEFDSDISLSKSWESLLFQEEAAKTWSHVAETGESSLETDSRKPALLSRSSFSQVDTVVGAYESCHTKQLRPETCTEVSSKYGAGVRGRDMRMEGELKVKEFPRKPIGKGTTGRVRVREAGTSHVVAATMDDSEVSSGFKLANDYDNLTEQVRSLQMELKSLLRSDSWYE